jgi:Arc/MetJ-type ribon-helix-helix transcriptional regulator
MKITIELPANLEAALRAHLDRRGVSVSTFVRDAIAEKLEREPEARSTPYEVGKDLFGKHGSGRSDLSSNRKAIMGEMLRARHRR